MNVVETVLVFVGIPLGITGLLATAIYGRSLARSSNRYRPGKGWEHDPVWYLPNTVPTAHGAAAPTLKALPVGTNPPSAAVGGATGEW